MDIGAFGRGKAKQGKGKHGKGKGKGKQGQQGQQGQQGRDRSKDRDKNKEKNTNKGGSKGKHKPKNAPNADNLDSTKPANVIGVDTGAGKTAWPQSVTYGKKVLGHVDLTFRTATGELVKSGERLYVEGCVDWGSQSSSSRFSSAGMETTIVCWRIHDDGWSHCLV